MAEFDLILHIGFPKCASTTLQNLVFNNEDGYLGTAKGLPYSKNFASQLRGISSAGPRLFANYKQVSLWVQKINKIMENKYPDINRMILSNEMFANRNKLKDRPIIDFLKQFNERIWKDGQVKVLLILRNSAERIASGYAQVSISNPRASQVDFEHHAKRQLKRSNRICYDKWVEELYESLGEENVCVLLMEDIRQRSFWQELKEFCQLDRFDVDQWISESKSSNTRKKDETTWNLRSFDPQQKARTLAINIFGMLWPPQLLQKVRKSIFEHSIGLASLYFHLRYGSGAEQRSEHIKLTPELRRQIQSAYQSHTEQLSRLLGRELKTLGY